VASWSLHGIVIDADIELGRPAGPGTEPAVILDVGEPRPIGSDPPPGVVLLQREVEDRPFQTAAREGPRTTLRIHGLCDFRLADGSDRVVCVPDPVLTRDQLALLVRGAFLAFYLGLRGECVLHASAVDVTGDGSALVFVGGAGWGKSTMAAWLCSVGARLIVDDLLRLDESRPPRWAGTSSELRLRPTSESLVTSAPPTWSPRPTVDGRTALAPLITRHDAGELAAVVLPARSLNLSGLQVAALDPVEALLELVRFPRLDGWQVSEVIESHFDALSRLTEAVPVYRACLPWGPPFTREAALELLTALGLPIPAVAPSG
jgi:hypothetical protein